jgi:hypothetical protein
MWAPGAVTGFSGRGNAEPRRRSGMDSETELASHHFQDQSAAAIRRIGLVRRNSRGDVAGYRRESSGHGSAVREAERRPEAGLPMESSWVYEFGA